jgi:hypothetical protein
MEFHIGTFPIKHSKANHQRTKDIQVDSDVDWQKQHYKSLETAYRGISFLSFLKTTSVLSSKKAQIPIGLKL